MIKQFAIMFLAVSTTLGVGGAQAQAPHHPHHAFPKDVDAFHALFAPIWHAPAGKARIRNACAQAPQIERLARDIQSTDATQLVATIGAFQARCKARRAEAEAALADVHEAFHGLIDAPAPASTTR